MTISGRYLKVTFVRRIMWLFSMEYFKWNTEYNIWENRGLLPALLYSGWPEGADMMWTLPVKYDDGRYKVFDGKKWRSLNMVTAGGISDGWNLPSFKSS